MRDAASKIVGRERLRELVTEHKREGRRVVLANGCFDTLHGGHVLYLEGARREGDILVVAVNSDSSVCALKGAGRPILAEGARVGLVATPQHPPYVVLFSESNVEVFLKYLRTVVHAKGTDYTAETVPERATAARLGIRVAIVGDSKDHSTRELLETIRKAPHA